MNRSKLIIFTALTTVILTVVLYKPVSITVFHLTEPNFKCPIRLNSGDGIVVRSDVHGDGDFGAKRRNGRSHSGIDIQAPVGTPVRASKSGLAFCLNVPTGYGKYVLIYHPDGMLTLYGHLSEWNIESATRVKQGRVIGLVGKTGNAGSKYIEPHLHFEIRKNNVPQDPRNLMR
ncbi:MAG: M23 family metallopeptidase [Candidatus Omnitrophica bacterium]|nr:M23 family metallopeptidase [Candidatus Omnitrophota bacterium]